MLMTRRPAHVGVHTGAAADLGPRFRGDDKRCASVMSFSRKRESSQRNTAMQVGERYAVYIMASCRNGTLYVGVTNSLAIGAHQHRSGRGSEFTRKYGVTQLVWYEFHSNINEAITREKRIKKWERRWKLELIESFNRE